MGAAGLPVSGSLVEMLASADVVVDATPKAVATANIAAYRSAGLKFIVQGGEKHSATGHSFVAEASYLTALNRQSTRVVSCNTTSIVRTLTALKRTALLLKARGVLLRRATNPWESHQGGIMNTLVPEPGIPSHRGPDAQGVDLRPASCCCAAMPGWGRSMPSRNGCRIWAARAAISTKWLCGKIC